MFHKEASSFRDPSGFVYYKNSKIYRQINWCYKHNYDYFLNTGLKDELINKNLIIRFTETTDAENNNNYYKIIEAEKLSHITYPYEWCFSQLKDAALTTLNIQRKALDYNMVLKDASAYNIQFWQGIPILIDILSFEKYEEGSPWRAYKQFCEHFLCPLLLIKYKSADLNHLSKIFIDGIPLKLTSELLPLKTHFNFNILSHIHSHALYQKKYEKKHTKRKNLFISKNKQIILIDNLIHFVESINIKQKNTEWADYYSNNNYTYNALNHKKELILLLTEQLNIKSVIDFGANDGTFSSIFSQQHIETLTIDSDPMAVELNYKKAKAAHDVFLTPFIADISNPSPAIGWENNERKSMLSRLNCDLALSLALIHHLVITHNLSFKQIAAFFSQLCSYLIIEFIPFDDSQIQKMTMHRNDDYNFYTEDNFTISFQPFFTLIKKENINESKRSLYLFKNINKNV